MLSTSDLEAIHEATLKILNSVGLKVSGDEALEIYADAGCQVDRESSAVRIPRHVVEDAISAAPAEVLLAGREPHHDVVLGGRTVSFTNFGTGIAILDPYTGRLRDSTKQDVADTARICDAIEEIDLRQ